MSVFLSAAVVAAAWSCRTGPTDPSQPPLAANYDFRLGPQGWTCDAAGYSTSNPVDRYGIVLEYRPLKGVLASQGSAWLLNGKDSLGLILFCKRRVIDLVPNRSYTVTLTIEIATNTSPGCAGIGAPPGEGVLVIGGLGTTNPLPYLHGTDMRVNLGRDWPQDGDVLGNIAMAAKGLCNDLNPWELKTLVKSGLPFVASATGDAWLVAGITKGFTGPNEVYLTKVKADFR